VVFRDTRLKVSVFNALLAGSRSPILLQAGYIGQVAVYGLSKAIRGKSMLIEVKDVCLVRTLPCLPPTIHGLHLRTSGT
jgi:hypothetical protein